MSINKSSFVWLSVLLGGFAGPADPPQVGIDPALKPPTSVIVRQIYANAPVYETPVPGEDNREVVLDEFGGSPEWTPGEYTFTGYRTTYAVSISNDSGEAIRVSMGWLRGALLGAKMTTDSGDHVLVGSVSTYDAGGGNGDFHTLVPPHRTCMLEVEITGTLIPQHPCADDSVGYHVLSRTHVSVNEETELALCNSDYTNERKELVTLNADASAAITWRSRRCVPERRCDATVPN